MSPVCEPTRMSSFPELALLCMFDHLPLVDLLSVVPLVCKHWHRLQPEVLSRRHQLQLLPPLSTTGEPMDNRQWIAALDHTGPVVHLINPVALSPSPILNQEGKSYHYRDTLHPCCPDGWNTFYSTRFIRRLSHSLSDKLTSLSVFVNNDWSARDLSDTLMNVANLVGHWRHSLAQCRVVVDAASHGNQVSSVNHLIAMVNECHCLRLLQLDLHQLKRPPAITLSPETLARLDLLVLGPHTSTFLPKSFQPSPELKLRIVSPETIQFRALQMRPNRINTVYQWFQRYAPLLGFMDLYLASTDDMDFFGSVLAPFQRLSTLRVKLYGITLDKLFSELSGLALPALTNLSVIGDSRWWMGNLNLDIGPNGRPGVVLRSIRWFTLQVDDLKSHLEFDQLGVSHCLPSLEVFKLKKSSYNSYARGCKTCHNKGIDCHLTKRWDGLPWRLGQRVREVWFNRRRYIRPNGKTDFMLQ